MDSLPGATVTRSDASIAGRPAVELDVAIDAAVDYASGSIEAFHQKLLTDTCSWAFAPGELQTMYIFEIDATNTFLLWDQGPAAEAQAVLDSIEFIDAMPTPGRRFSRLHSAAARRHRRRPLRFDAGGGFR